MEESIRCSTAPGKIFKSRDELHEHYQSDLHRYNLRRKAAGLAPITEEIFNKMKVAMQQREEQAKREQATKKLDHVKQSKRAQQQQQQMEVEKKNEGKGNTLRNINNSNTVGSAASNDAARTNNNEDNNMDGAEEEEEEIVFDEEEMKKPVDLTMSLFDQHKSETVDENLEYMKSYYGFLFPDEEYICDKEGMLKYCAQKIGIGKICLFCEKHFRSKDACVKHMLAKGHCKIRWEYEEDIEEFSEYYKFEDTDEEMEGEDGEAKPRAKKASKQTMEITESGEYIFRDGDRIRRVGVRQFRMYYRQKLAAPKEQKASVAANAREELVRLYKNSGMDEEDAYSSASLAVMRTDNNMLALRSNPVARREMKEKRHRILQEHKYQLAAGMLNNLLMKNAIAGSNRGVGHGVRKFNKMLILFIAYLSQIILMYSYLMIFATYRRIIDQLYEVK